MAASVTTRSIVREANNDYLSVNRQVVDTLIQMGADLELQTKERATALHLACLNGHLKCTRLLIKGNADIDLQTNDGDTALHLAAYNGHASTLELLLDAEAQVLQNNNSETVVDLYERHECEAYDDTSKYCKL
ncbi:ankyrin repeat domain-containing protein 6-like isoform X4 [Anneissia japonica]|uniref:ankyrin repeat domain-containing protein 6-like isoform X4 n=1 Tax=Anneissia japonica TaxID=1529436 RepID=UPI00142570C3|nr:ankyrin repeat domain-containing protein 6-like isoform X4 [Anneissia japonica]XP_033124696.1 ankyrin repeat domain-containing protein 6-like isoform X4 [Anneissia japonica]